MSAKKAVRFTEHEYLMTISVNITAPTAKERLEQAKKAVDTTLDQMRGKSKKKVALILLNYPKGKVIQLLNLGHCISPEKNQRLPQSLMNT